MSSSMPLFGNTLHSATAPQLIIPTIENHTCCLCEESFPRRGEFPVILNCGHCFGSKCISKWLKQKPTNKCPLCRKDPRDISRVQQTGAATEIPANPFAATGGIQPDTTPTQDEGVDTSSRLLSRSLTVVAKWQLQIEGFITKDTAKAVDAMTAAWLLRSTPKENASGLSESYASTMKRAYGAIKQALENATISAVRSGLPINAYLSLRSEVERRQEKVDTDERFTLKGRQAVIIQLATLQSRKFTASFANRMSIADITFGPFAATSLDQTPELVEVWHSAREALEELLTLFKDSEASRSIFSTLDVDTRRLKRAYLKAVETGAQDWEPPSSDWFLHLLPQSAPRPPIEDMAASSTANRLTILGTEHSNNGPSISVVDSRSAQTSASSPVFHNRLQNQTSNASSPMIYPDLPPCEGTGSTPFSAYTERESPNGPISHFQCINFTVPYRDFCFEELKLADYNQGRRFGTVSASREAIGTTNTGLFNPNTRPVFGQVSTSGLFSIPSSLNNASSLSSSLFTRSTNDPPHQPSANSIFTSSDSPSPPRSSGLFSFGSYPVSLEGQVSSFTGPSNNTPTTRASATPHFAAPGTSSQPVSSGLSSPSSITTPSQSHPSERVRSPSTTTPFSPNQSQCEGGSNHLRNASTSQSISLSTSPSNPDSNSVEKARSSGEIRTTLSSTLSSSLTTSPEPEPPRTSLPSRPHSAGPICSSASEPSLNQASRAQMSFGRTARLVSRSRPRTPTPSVISGAGAPKTNTRDVSSGTLAASIAPANTDNISQSFNDRVRVTADALDRSSQRSPQQLAGHEIPEISTSNTFAFNSTPTNTSSQNEAAEVENRWSALLRRIEAQRSLHAAAVRNGFTPKKQAQVMTIIETALDLAW